MVYSSVHMKPVFKILLLGGLFLFSSALYAQESEVVQVGTIERHPFVFVESDQLTGFSIDLWERLAEDLGLNTQYKITDTFSEMIGWAEKGGIDLAIANISITQDREAVMDFSHPIFDSGVGIMINDNAIKPNILSVIMSSGILGILLVSFLVLLVAAHIVWLLERGDKGQDYFDNSYRKGIWDAFWWAFIIVTTGGFENEAPKRPWGRLFAAIWVVIGLFFVSFITAKITSSFTVGELQSQVDSIDDLRNRSVATVEGSTSDTYLADTGISYTTYETLNELFADIENGKLDAVVHDLPILNYYAASEGGDHLSVLEQVFKPEKFGILLPQGSQLIEGINQHILKYQEDGTYQSLYKKWFE